MPYKTILIVDNDPSNLSLLFRCLQTAGYSILVHTTGESALAAMDQVQPDLILLDIMMSGIDGFETSRRLKANPATRDIPVIFMTAQTDPLDEVKGLELGAVDFITKPFQAQTVLARVKTHISIQMLRKQLEEKNEQLQQRAMELVSFNEKLQKQAVERKQVEQNLRASQEYARNIIDSSLDMIITVDNARRIVEFNAAAQRIFGYRPDEIIGTHVQTLYANPDDANTVYQTVAEMGQCVKEVINQRKNGETFHSLVSGSILRDAAGEPVGTMGISRDITDRKKAEEELKRAKAEAESANRAKSQFLARMSHEIRTPMNAILGLTHLTLQTDLTDKQTEYLTKIQSSAYILLGIINEILDFSKIEAGKMELESIEFYIKDLLNEVSDLMRMRADEKGLKFKVSAAIDVPPLLVGDPLRLEQILINLTGNAIKFTETGEIHIYLEVIEKTDAVVTIRLSVKDTGIGIAPEQIESLFHPFIQADGSVTRKFGGTGLGLAICKHLAEMMGGKICVQSDIGQGSEFSLTLPFKYLPDDKNAVRTRARDFGRRLPEKGDVRQTLAFKTIKGSRVLLIEDNVINRMVVKELLEQVGLSVDEAVDGREGVRMMLGAEYDLGLMDIEMPEMDGYAATRKIREMEQEREKAPGGKGPCRTPIVAMTAHVMSGERERCLKAGMDDYIGKPIVPAQLYAVLLKWIMPGELPEIPDGSAADVSGIDATDASPPFPWLPGIDTSAGLKRVGGNRELYVRLLKQFHADYAGSTASIRNKLERGDTNQAARMAHTLKGVAGHMGAAGLHRAAGKLESEIRNNRIKDTGVLLTHFEKMLKLVIDSIGSMGENPPSAPESVETRAEETDASRIIDLLTRISALIQEGDTEAEEQLSDLRKHLKGSHAQDRLRILETQLRHYDFEEALQTIKGIMGEIN
jgi:PAS domain S-box-containing protein